MTIQTYLTNLCKHSGIDEEHVVVDVQEDETYVKIQLDVPAEDSGLFIGFHGETLASIQRLLRIIFQEQYGDKKIVVNVNDYRQQREAKLQEMAASIADRVLDSNQEYHFGFMPPHERYVIHAFISEDERYTELESVSEGEGTHRHLIIRRKVAA